MSNPRNLHMFNRPPPPRLRVAAPCACCIMRHRYCSLHCIWAPYFPARMVAEFFNVSRLFPIHYIEHHLIYLRPQFRQDFITSVVYEANRRALNAVHGCGPIIDKLREDIQFHEEELRIIREQLAYQRAKFWSDSQSSSTNI